MATKPQVILYSTSQHCWEVWSDSRPLGQGSLDACRRTYPDAQPVSDHQRLLALADEFHQGLPWLGDGAAVLDLCESVSSEFAALLTEHGLAAETVSGVLMGSIPEFPDTTAVLAGHYATLVRYDDGNGPVETVYDWTARQFEPTARVPLVQPLVQWRETWADIATIGAS